MVFGSCISVTGNLCYLFTQTSNHVKDKLNTTDHFSVRLRDAMSKAGIGGSDLARRIGQNPSAISRWLRDTIPDIVNATKIAEVLGVDVHWLLTGTASQLTRVSSVVSEQVPLYGGAPLQPSTQPEHASAVTLLQLSGAMMQVLSRIAQIEDTKWRNEALTIVQPVCSLLNVAIGSDSPASAKD